MANEKAAAFRAEPIMLDIGGVSYALKFDLNAFCELEKIYDSVDDILQMILGTSNVPDLQNITYCGAPCLATDILIAGVPLETYLEKLNQVKQAKHSDTRNLLWAGCIHAFAEYDEFGEIRRYNLSKAKIAEGITFKNLREINMKIVTAILRDLLPAGDSEKNVEAPGDQETQLTLLQS